MIGFGRSPKRNDECSDAEHFICCMFRKLSNKLDSILRHGIVCSFFRIVYLVGCEVVVKLTACWSGSYIGDGIEVAMVGSEPADRLGQ